MFPVILPVIVIFIYGILIGSFLNVCIYRIPKKENIVTTRSHCMNCDYQLRWYDLIPLFSWISLGGKCRKCGTKISVQYPLIEALNGILYVAVFLCYGLSIETLLYCLLTSALIVLSVIDFRIYEIPVGINWFIAGIGLIRVFTDMSDWTEYVIGFFSVSAFLYLLYILTKGRGIGGGDIKLMAVSGLVLGWKCNVLGFICGCIVGVIIHIFLMIITKKDHVMAMGPYLSIGIFLSVLFGDKFIAWYLTLLGI